MATRRRISCCPYCLGPHLLQVVAISVPAAICPPRLVRLHGDALSPDRQFVRSFVIQRIVVLCVAPSHTTLHGDLGPLAHQNRGYFDILWAAGSDPPADHIHLFSRGGALCRLSKPSTARVF